MPGYKINSNKSVAFLYTNDKQVEKEITQNSLHNSYKEYKISWGNSKQTSEISVRLQLQVSQERNRRRCQKMERSPMFTDCQN
jgi:hypothetical protein